MDHSVFGETLACNRSQWRPIPRFDVSSEVQLEETDKPDISHKQDKAPKRLPLFLHKGGRRLQYAWDGHHLRVVEERFYPAESSRSMPWVEDSVAKVRGTLKAVFVPEHVRSNYIVYLRWKCLHRIFSSALQVQCTQAMLRAVGVGARRALPSAAALNWVLKDGLGRLGRFLYTASLGRTFDSDLKRVRFSTSVVFSMSLGLELLTPKYPEKFLLLATIANVAKSISLAAYLATSSTIHRSFALADNLADISAKSQAQTVVLDNLGLGLTIWMNNICKHNERLQKILPLLTYPIFSAIDLFALYQGLKSIQFSTLNKARLEIVVEQWLKSGKVPSVEEANKEEGGLLLSNLGRRSLPLKIGAPNIRNQNPEHILALLQAQSSEQQKYLLLGESDFNWLGKPQNSLLLWPHRAATAKDIVLGVLQACYLRLAVEGHQHTFGGNCWPSLCYNNAETQPGTCSMGMCLHNDTESTQWHNVLWKSQSFAQQNIQSLLIQMEDAGWLMKHILLSAHESASYSTD